MVRLLPRDTKFFQYFQEEAENAREVAQALSDLLFDFTDVPEKVRRLEDLEHRGDEITHRILSALDTTFLTPFDREDIRELAATLDDFVDYITAAAGRLVLYNIDRPTESAQLFGRIIAEQGEAIASAIALLAQEEDRREILAHIVELNRLEDEADDALSETLAGLYADVHDIPGVIKEIRWEEIYHRLEDVADRGEDLANTLEGIISK